MLRYRLDDLGWFHFEKLVQSVLKADLGLAIESWGGHSDFGRDAYARTRLRFPDRSKPKAGPFIFQAKFVQGANAAGAAWHPLLLKAISSERKEIQRRRKSYSWQDPKHYVLLTNCPLTSGARAAVESKLRAEMPNTEITQLGGTDVCDLLDRHPELRRSFPEILSLRDLDLLLAEAVSKQILERSRAAVEESRDLIPVFVPTEAYHKAWRSLQKHHFVVLDGPPEMGKTAIARTIALGHLISDWQAIDCRDPGDLFSVFTDHRQQVFVADDAFGRTEYDPVLGRMWERDLPRVFHCLDSRHRLIWTTRKHILIRALREMDLTGRASRFPNPGEVIVTADDLSVEEKARILYRHSRAASLETELRTMVRENAVAIVRNQHFTPERIRRFVRELLPELSSRAARGSVTNEQISTEIGEAIRNPTDRMRKSFRKLDKNHRWILIAFLECDQAVHSDVLRDRFASHQASVSAPEFEEALDDLLGTFLKLGSGRFTWVSKRIDWIHPSYRDLVIDELSSNAEEQAAFLKHISTTGIKLALSHAGGSSGERENPLVSSDESWTLLDRRCRELASAQDVDALAELLDVLTNALKSDRYQSSAVRMHIAATLRSVCERAVPRWDESGDPLDLDALKSFLAAWELLDPQPALPEVESTWKSMSEEVRGQISAGYVLNPTQVLRWSDLSEIVGEHYTLVAETSEFRDGREEIESELFDLAEDEVKNGTDLQDPETNESEGRRLGQLADVLFGLDRDSSRNDVVSGLYGLADVYKENGPSGEEDPDYEGDENAATSGEVFDIDGLFEDL